MFMIFRVIAFGLALLWNGQAFADVVSVSASGSGADMNKAVYDALNNAISQVTGIMIDTDNVVNHSHNREFSFENGKEKIIEYFNNKMKSNSKARIKGVVVGYEILSSEVDNNDLYHVSLRVDVEKYKTPGISNENRRGVVVLPFEVVQANVCGSSSAKSKVGNALVTALSSQLTSSRKFKVLDRYSKKSYDSEKNLILDEDTVFSERAKLGQVEATDYILTGIIQDIQVSEEAVRNPITGAIIDNKNIRGHMIVDFNVIVFATRQVKFSSSVKVNMNFDKTQGMTCSEATDRLIKHAASKAVDQLLDDIFPMTVIKVSSEFQRVYLNLGGDRVKVGQNFGLYMLGEELFDPYTGEPLGAEEIDVGRVEIVAVKPKFSVGKLVKGDFSNVKRGQICRRIPN